MGTGRITLRNLLMCAVGVCSLSSCLLEDYEIPTEETYTREFVKVFGAIDPNQDWNMATRGSVTVNSPSSGEVQVYVKNGSKYYLAAVCDNLQGSKTIGFDMPRGCSDLLVMQGCESYTAKSGGSVDFGANGTRAGETYANNITIDTSYTDSIYTFSYSDATTWQNKLPKTDSDGNETVDNRENKNVTESFRITTTAGDDVSSYSFYVYPVFWNTGATNVDVGICYINSASEMVRHNIYSLRGNNRLQCTTKNDNKIYYSELNNEIDGISISGVPTEDQKTTITAYIQNTYGKNVSVTNWGSSNNNYITLSSSVYHNWTEVAYKNKNKASQAEATALNSNSPDLYFRSYATKIVVPTNMTFGFYIDQYVNGTQNYMYSYNDWNKKFAGTKNGIAKSYYSTTATDAYNYTFCATFQPETEGTGIDYYLCFEDWPNKYRDLCDVVLAFSATPDTYQVVEDESQSWILAAEDMGSIGDFDFNDMVVKVSHVAGKSDVTITPLAAGGTLPLRLYHKKSSGDVDFNTAGETFHSWFGNGISDETMINTYANNTKSTAQTLTLSDADKETFTMATNKYYDASSGTNYSDTCRMGNFYFTVTKEVNGQSTTTETVTAPQIGAAPQMICVPASWHWPKEKISITEAYPGDSNGENSFVKWAGTDGKTESEKSNVDWCGYYDSSLVLP